MKIVSVTFPDTVDISSLSLNSTVQVGTVTGGTVAMVGQFPDPPAGASPTHTHNINAPVAGLATGVSGPPV